MARVAEPFDIASFLGEPSRMAQVASVSASGVPPIGSLWFVFAGGRFWFSSRHGSVLTRAMTRGGGRCLGGRLVASGEDLSGAGPWARWVRAA